MTANLDVVRSILANWERGDLSSMDWADRDIDFVFADGPEPGTHVGRAAMQELFRSWLNSFATISLRRARPLRTCSSCAAAKSRGSSCTSTATRP